MKIEKFCLECGETLPDYAPTNKQYCSDACKQSAYRERLESEDDHAQKVSSEDEGGLHLLTWFGIIGAAAWVFNSTSQNRNKTVTTPSVPPIIPPSSKL